MSGVSREKPTARPVQCVTLDDPAVLGGLSHLESLLRGCLGAGGGSAAVTFETGVLSVASSAERLLAALPVPSAPLALVTTAIRHQTTLWRDGGLAAGCLLTGLLRRLLLVPAPRHLLRLRLQQAADVCRRAADRQRLRLALDVPQLLAVVGTVLRSKPAVPLSAAERRHLSLQVLRAFLQAVPADAAAADGRAVMGEVHVQVVAAGEVAESRPVPALLLREPSLDDESALSVRPAGRLHCLLFTPHLGGPEEALADAEVALPAELARRALSADRCVAALARLDLSRVGVIGCQRTVHADVRRALAGRGVLVLERLGSRGAALFARLTCAAPLGGLSLLGEVQRELRDADQGVLVGRLDSVRVKTLGGKGYVELCRAAAPLVTLLVHYAQPEDQREELKRQIDASLLSLCSLLADPTVLPGGGCLETVLHSHLVCHAAGKDRVTQQVVEAMCNALRQNAISISGRHTLWSDAVYRHAWKAEVQDSAEDGSCVCGLVRVPDLRGNRDFDELTAAYVCDSGSKTGSGETRADLDARDICEETVVDCARVKTSGLKIALEACHAILGIGTCVFEKR